MATSREIAASFGKMPTTLARLLISLLSRSSGLVLQILRQLLGDVQERQHVLSGDLHHGHGYGELHAQHLGDPLPAAALEHALDRHRQAQVGNPSGEGFAYGDHKPGAGQASLLLLRRSLRLEAAPELAPEALGVAVAHGNAEHLAVAEGVVARWHPRSSCRWPPPPPTTSTPWSGQGGRGGKWRRGRRRGSGHGPKAGPERLSPAHRAPGSAAHLRFGDAAGPAQRLHQGVDLAGGDAPRVSLHHHGIEGLVHPTAWLQPVGEEAALPELLLRRSLRLGDGQGEVTNLGGEQPLPVAVAMGRALIGAALMELGTGQGRNLGFQHVLEAPAHDHRDQGASGGALQSWLRSEASLLVRVVVCVRFGGRAPNRVRDRPTHCHNRDLREEHPRVAPRKGTLLGRLGSGCVEPRRH
jgi:hypothetical protein